MAPDDIRKAVFQFLTDVDLIHNCVTDVIYITTIKNDLLATVSFIGGTRIYGRIITRNNTIHRVTIDLQEPDSLNKLEKFLNLLHA